MMPSSLSEISVPTSNPVALLPPYTIEKDQLFPGTVVDSRCHMDFIYRRLNGEEVKSGQVQSLQACLDLDREELGSSVGGCVANFWGRGGVGDWCLQFSMSLLRMQEFT